ncbi:tRNA glutamyl-Q(34) synthetase GluQRS [Pseudoalteromonas sp. SMS1]|uniref:tRNA glutamyl-Q(34) synthetase GluQRS n=1 Tax=Pseudoalteromonas sp. SMS1 TaxID=2908894 RepID=UPI001F40084E|nr:tRNA glutamyl-Q(34) synthetase GluQRS [Pseudoalteromonas sp. SMS1]MCF2856824.1 tRNA glutamyl-Q(34) synthetase GluQRS [Pseudoalteromonas sp. SMS1]
MQISQDTHPEQGDCAALGIQHNGYRGRFAPSPSGPLHFGSLVAALASYLDAKAHNGQWLVRIEDIDTPRVVAGADDAILTTLDAYGLHWDGKVEYQSQRHTLYQDVLSSLVSCQHVYACTCTRKQIKARGGYYDNHCRAEHHRFDSNALRLQQNYPVMEFEDGLQGHVQIPDDIAREDYIIKRRDGLFAYQLVVVVDDHDQGITHVVRGADLLEPTARQISLFKQLAYPTPHFTHVPLAVATPGFKLSKQNHAPAIDNQNPLPALMAALTFLGFSLSDLQFDSIDALLTWAISNYQRANLPHNKEIQVIQQDNLHYTFTPL